MTIQSNGIQRWGTMFIFSAPSGGGKSTIIKRLLQELADIRHSVSVTTRAKRDGETEGEDYYFVSEEEFRRLVADNALYEYVDSDFGPKYGTPRKPVDDLLTQGKDVVLDLDYPGVVQLRKLAGDRVKAIALLPPSVKVLKQRLAGRGTDSAETIDRRMRQAEKRIRESVFYDYVIVNDNLDRAVAEAKAVITAVRTERKNLCGLERFIEDAVKEK